jgi:hypothetical protein
MSGAGEPPSAPAAVEEGRDETRPPRPGLGLVVGLVVGVIAVSGALFAVASGTGDDETTRERVARSSTYGHEFPADYAGPVWVTVDAVDATAHTVTIAWGPWERRIIHEDEAPVTYVFTKNPPEPGDENVPTTVTVEPDAEVTFGNGPTPPADAVDVNADWTATDDTSTTGST